MRVALRAIPAGVALYYAGGLTFALIEAHRVSRGSSFAAAVAGLEPWSALVLVPAALIAGVGFAAFAQRRGR